MVENIDTFVKGVSAECISVKNSSVGDVLFGLPLQMVGIDWVLLPRVPLSRIPLLKTPVCVCVIVEKMWTSVKGV